MSMQGNLVDMSVADLIQHNCKAKKQAQLIIETFDSQAELWFDAGALVHATLGELAGEEVVYQVLSWEKGQFFLRTGAPPPRKTITRSYTGLLLESALRLDDSRPEAQQAQDQDSSSSNAETEKREALRKLRLAGIDATMLGVVAEAVTDYETHTALMYVIPGWAVMDTALKLRIIFYSLAVLGYGRVDAEQMNGTSTKVTLRTKFLAEKSSDGASSETGADARYCHGLEDYLQAAFAIATGKGWKAVQVEETQCRAAGFEMCEFQVNVK